MTADPFDPRVYRVGICGVTRITGNTEWICVADVHDDPPRPGHGQKSVQPSRPYGYHPRSQRHYFVPRYPWRNAT